MSLKENTLSKYVTEVFVETGTHVGDGVLSAIQAGFKRIISIEIEPRFHQIAKERLKEYPNVELLLGDSGILLPQIISTLTTQATFWLDAHYAGVDNLVLQELDIIRTSSIKNHIILIDDMRCCPSIQFHMMLKNKIFAINKCYVTYI